MPNVKEKSLYDSAVKQEFIEQCYSTAASRKLPDFIFRALSEYEERWGKDFAEFDEEQANIAVNSIPWYRSNGIASMLYILKQYIRWRKEKRLPTTNAIFSVRIDAIEKYRAKMVGNPQHLLLSLNAVFPHPEDNEIEYIYRSFLWMAFLGFDDDEAIRVRQDEVNFDEMRIDFADSDLYYPIYREAVKDLRKAATLTVLKEPRGRYEAVKERMPGDELLRGKIPPKPMEEFLSSTMRPMISRAFAKAMKPYASGEIEKPDSLSLELSYRYIYLSGIFYRTYEGERIGQPVSFQRIVEHETKDISPDDERFGRTYTLNKRRRCLLRGYMNDYQAWKAAFSAD